jgi:hypothetical protein
LLESDESARSRRNFIARLASGVAGISTLAACGGGAHALLAPGVGNAGAGAVAALKDTPELQHFMRRNDVRAVLQRGILVLRDDNKGNIELVTTARKISPNACTQIKSLDDGDCGDSGGGGNGDSGDGGDSGSGDSGSGDASPDGDPVSVAAVVHLPNGVSASVQYAFPGWYQMFIYIPGSGPVTGPWYDIPKMSKCTQAATQQAMAGAWNLAVTIKDAGGGWLQSAVGIRGAAILFQAAKNYYNSVTSGSNSYSLALFWSVITAVIPAQDIAIALGAAAEELTLAQVYDFVLCDLG